MYDRFLEKKKEGVYLALTCLRKEKQNQNLKKRRSSQCWRELSRQLSLESEMKLITEEFEELLKKYPLYSQEKIKIRL